MLEHLPKEVREGLLQARKRAERKKSRLRVQVGTQLHPILRMWDTGLALDAATAPHLRGLVDIYDGSRHLWQALIVASAEAEGELVCEFKWIREALDRPPLDFERDETAPAGLLPRG